MIPECRKMLTIAIIIGLIFIVIFNVLDTQMNGLFKQHKVTDKPPIINVIGDGSTGTGNVQNIAVTQVIEQTTIKPVTVTHSAPPVKYNSKTVAYELNPKYEDNQLKGE